MPLILGATPPLLPAEEDTTIIKGLKESLDKPIFHEHVHELININKNKSNYIDDGMENFNKYKYIDKKYGAIFDKKYDTSKYKDMIVGSCADGPLNLDDFLRRMREGGPAAARPQASQRPLEAELERVEF